MNSNLMKLMKDIEQDQARVDAKKETAKRTVIEEINKLVATFGIKASERGHSVTLFEKGDRLGGQLAMYPDHLWFKNHVRDLREYFITQLAKSNVTVLLNTRATPKLIEDADFDAIFREIERTLGDDRRG